MRYAKAVFCVLLLFLGITWSQSLEKCADDVEEVEECTDTEYHSYVECMRRRSKRSIDCNRSCDDCGSVDDCNDCDCNYCSYNECSSSCNNCCESAPPPCQTRNCCHQTCNNQCKTISCRRRCRSKCQSKITPGGGGSTHTQTSTNANISAGVKTEARHNITTVINLHNIINNTNIIDMPITLNNTNINNITVESPEPGESRSTLHIIEKTTEKEKEKEEVQEKENCCKIVGPRQCMQTKVFPFMKCFHYRRQHCGELCRTPIMHAEPHEVCDQVNSGSPSCHQQIAYIPQPQPKCTYTSSWPYVSCNIAKPNCGGCYQHVVQGGPPPQSCAPSCYDQGFNVGPLFRQGPYFQGGFSGMPQVPSCALSGNCEGAPFPVMGQQPQQQYYPFENPMENMMQIEPSPQAVPYGDVQHPN